MASIHQQLHIYSQDAGGIIKHTLAPAHDLGGEKGVIGEIITLSGWPTPAMRHAADGAGNPVTWYIGTDDDGEIIYAA